jgi:hypothetical protein
LPKCSEKADKQKEAFMPQNNNDNRVLVRLGARKLTENEVNHVAGGALTFASVIFTNGGKDEGFDQ